MRWRTEIALPGLSLSSHPHRDPLFQAAKCVLYLPGCVGTREIARARIEVDLMPETRPLPKLVSTELKHWVKKRCLLGPRRSHRSCLCGEEDAVLHKAGPSDFVEWRQRCHPFQLVVLGSEITKFWWTLLVFAFEPMLVPCYALHLIHASCPLILSVSTRCLCLFEMGKPDLERASDTVESGCESKLTVHAFALLTRILASWFSLLARSDGWRAFGLSPHPQH